jgi:uncharacterized membrane protein
MIWTLAIVWVVVGFAGGLNASRKARDGSAVLILCAMGIVSGPFSVMLNYFV